MAKRFGFRVDRERLEEVVKAICGARDQKRGVYALNEKQFLPQWNLPQELEYNPQREETNNPLEASKYLWTSAYFERLSQSRTIMRNALKTWHSDKRWIFDSYEVSRRMVDDTKEVLRDYFQFGLQSTGEEAPHIRFKDNATKLYKEYSGDPRNLVDGLSVDESRRRLMEFKGIGTGIANLYIIYLLDRKIASPSDPENILFKVDIHKARIPLNTNSLIPQNGDVHRDDISGVLEQEYLTVCKSLDKESAKVDALIWLLGSLGCNKKDYHWCKANCPLVDRYCESNVSENQQTGRFSVYDSDGKRIETRKNMGQGILEFEI